MGGGAANPLGGILQTPPCPTYRIQPVDMEICLYSKHSARFSVYSFGIISFLVACTVLQIYFVDKVAFFNFELRPGQSSRDLTDILTKYLNKASKNPKILLSWHQEGDLTRVEKDSKLQWQCGSCIHTSNTSKLDDNNTAAVIFHFSDVIPEVMPPSNSRKSDQLYVWLSKESPASILVRSHISLLYADSVGFNVTKSYRRDADIYSPYLYSKKNPERDVFKIIEGKKRLAVAIVSNCGATPGARFRKLYLDYLSSKMDLDTFGRCFNHFFMESRGSNEFLDMISEYKFYFAFENSYHCRDYITEKFHSNAVRANTVPIVWGPPRSDYEAVVDPKSFIHVEDFKTAKDLIRYLEYLDKNDTAYGEYLKNLRWMGPTRVGNLLQRRAIGYCQLCRIANGINLDDRCNSKYNGTDIRPLFTDTVSQRTVSISKWVLEDNAECFQNMNMDSDGKANPITKNQIRLH